MKNFISITNFSQTISSIEFVINTNEYISKDNIFLYYNNKKFDCFDYEFLNDDKNNITTCKLLPYDSFNEKGYTTLFIETVNFISNTIFSYFSFDIIPVSSKECFTILTANIPEKMPSTNYKLDTFIPYILIDSIPIPVISIINSIDTSSSTVTINTDNDDYNIYNLTLIDKLYAPLPNNNYILNFYFKDGEIIIWIH